LLYCYIVTLLTVILNLIQNLLKNDPDLHQDDFTVILNLFQDRLQMILAFVKMTTTDDFTVIPEFNSGQALNLIQNVILNLIQDRLQMILAFVRMTTNVANVS